MKKRKPKLAPRNPFVAPALQRKAGAHQKSEKALRRKEKVALNRCVAQGQSNRLLTDRREFDPLHTDQPRKPKCVLFRGAQRWQWPRLLIGERASGRRFDPCPRSKAHFAAV